MFQLLVLFIFCILAMSKIRPRGFRYAVRIGLAVFCLSEIISQVMTEEPIGYQFYNHLQFETFRIAITSFPLLSLLGLAAFIAVVWLFTRLARLEPVRHYSQSKRRFAATMIILAFLMALPGGIINNLYRVIDGRMAAEERLTIDEAFAGLDIKAGDYVFRDGLTAEPGLNIVIISLESFERSILDRGDLAPGLMELTRRWTYLPHMKPSGAAATTIASLYSWQTGLPQYFGTRANSLFAKADSTSLVGLGDVLGQAGYERCYILGEPDFAGTRQFLTLYGYQVFGAYEDFPFPVERAGSFGPYDADVLALAKLKYEELSITGKPFLLAVSTVDTHLPGSRFRPDLAEAVRPTGEAAVDAVNASSHVVCDFLKFIEDRGDMECTVVFIMPDHLVPQAANAKRMGLSLEDRSLFLLTSAAPEKLPVKPEKPFYQYQLPGIILTAAGVETNAVFPADLSPHIFDDGYLEAGMKQFVKLNQALWVFKDNGGDDD
ncbi:hypothetical protein C4J81_05130 [Deltaproteobacteria bacterium Smac51]|nr:hypothetical protein C4J81_05130 [Deltaproteobacteria bacterium Smac51]